MTCPNCPWCEDDAAAGDLLELQLSAALARNNAMLYDLRAMAFMLGLDSMAAHGDTTPIAEAVRKLAIRVAELEAKQ